MNYRKIAEIVVDEAISHEDAVVELLVVGGRLATRDLPDDFGVAGAYFQAAQAVASLAVADALSKTLRELDHLTLAIRRQTSLGR